MSSLIESVLIVVGVGLVAMVGYNLWRSQSRRAPDLAAPAKSGSADAAPRREPHLEREKDGFAKGGEARQRSLQSAGDRPDQAGRSADDPTGAPSHETSGTLPREALAGGISEGVDCIVELRLDAVTVGETLIPIVQRFRRIGSKPVIVEGMRVDAGVASEPWGTLQAEGSYRVLRIGILLANRHGPLNAMEFSEFVGAIQELAEQLDCLADTPEMTEVLARARELDLLCAQLDAQIGINVQASERIETDALAALARAVGLHDRGAGRYARLGTAGEVLFTVSATESGLALGFVLDVPRTSASVGPLGQMFECARQCAQRLGASVVDDGGQTLTEEAVGGIGRQLDVRYASLEAASFPAGSALALRLFN